MMGNYLDKWKTLFPEVVGGTKRPLEAISDQDEFNTNGFPQFIAQDPVRYDLQNAFLKQFLSNDAWLWVRQQQADQALDRHKDDAQAHPNGVSGNAASATKLQTPRTLSLTGKAAGSATFDGSSNAAINVTSVNADTASKLSTARRINITGNATGGASFDGTSDININTTVNESKHAVNADVAKTLETTDKAGMKRNATFYWVSKDGQPAWLWGTGNEDVNAYAYNPSNFHVAAADIATTANTATKVNAKAPNGGTADLVFGTMAVNDYARVRVGGSNDNGWLEIATADGGNESIFVRQYSGPYDWPNGRPGTGRPGTVTNEAVLLDGSGNTKFPHNVTAPNFVGHLAGNADSATKIVNNGNRNNLANGTKAPSGLSVYQCYTNAGYPQQYGNVISIGGTGDNELFLGWQDDARPYYRNKVDVSNDWTSWKPLAFISDINYYAPTKTGGGASGTWGINISGNANTATKLATARTISLTGNASGSATFDGSGNISISTTVNDSKHAVNADTATNDSNGDKINDTYLKKATVIDVIYPIGSIYMSMSATNPHNLFGVGTWQRISQGRMLLGANDSTYKAGATGGEATHTLTAAEMPAHSHTGTTSTNGNHTHQVSRNIDLSDANPNHEGGSHDTICDYDGGTNFKTSTAGNHDHTFTTGNSGGGAAHNNMSPYLVCYIWQRTA